MIPYQLREWRTHPPSRGRTALAVIALALFSGCVRPELRGTLLPQDQAVFRAECVQVLREAALGDEPALRMNAIEALSEVAPAEGISCIALNIENEYPGASFAALMAVGTLRRAEFLDRVRTRAEHPDPNVRIAALFALHRLGDTSRTGELGDYLLKHRDARVRANGALAIGRLGEPTSAVVLHRALKQERKDLPKLQILEALAILGDRYANEWLIFDGSSKYPDQATIAIGFLANARSPEAEDLFRERLYSSRDFPEVNLAAARGLGRLGDESGLDLALFYLYFNSPRRGTANDSPEQQIARVRGLAALALESIGNPDALRALREAFQRPDQPPYVRIAVARAAIHIINNIRSPLPPASQPTTTRRDHILAS